MAIHWHRPPGSLAVVEHWRRLQRWEERFEKLCIAGKVPASIDVVDHAVVVLMNCFNMRDWLLNAWTGDRSEIDALFSSWELQVCRDVANGIKHLDISRPSVDAHHEVVRVYNPWPRPGEPREELVLHADGRSSELAAFSRACVMQVRRWLEARDLTTDKEHNTVAGLGPRLRGAGRLFLRGGLTGRCSGRRWARPLNATIVSRTRRGDGEGRSERRSRFGGLGSC
jgi:hypothetical protein